MGSQVLEPNMKGDIGNHWRRGRLQVGPGPDGEGRGNPVGETCGKKGDRIIREVFKNGQ